MVYLNNSLKEKLFTGFCDFHCNENIYVLLYTCTSLVPPSLHPPTLSTWSGIFEIRLLWSLVINPCTCPNVNINPNVNTFFELFLQWLCLQISKMLPSNMPMSGSVMTWAYYHVLPRPRKATGLLKFENTACQHRGDVRPWRQVEES